MNEGDGTIAFNLVDVPWILCRDIDNKVELVSLRDIASRPLQYVAIEGDSPQQDYALMRLLLVILWRSQVHSGAWDGGESQLFDWWMDAREEVNVDDVTEQMCRYLDSHKDRFDLCDAERPFMQVAGLHTANNSWASVRRLVPDSESTYFTMRAGRDAEKMSLAEAARWLVACQSWDYSGLKSGAVGDPRIKGGKGYPIGTGWSGRAGGVLLKGANLWHTLILNTVPAMVKDPADKPVWEREQCTAAPRSEERPDGPSDLLTWQSRRVRLHLDGDSVVGVLVCNGDKIATDNTFDDPMTSYRYSPTQTKKQGRDVYFPRSWDSDLAVWRGAQAILAGGVPLPAGQKGNNGRPAATVQWLAEVEHEEGRLDGRVSVGLVGIAYGQQDAVIETAIHDDVPVWMEVLADSSEAVASVVGAAVERTIEAAIALGRFVGNLRSDRGGEYVFDSAVKGVFLRDLEPDFTRWLGTLRLDNLLARRDLWYEFVESAVDERARSYLASVGPKAMTGRIDDQGHLHSAAVSYRKLQFQLREILDRRSEDSSASKGDQG